MMFTQYSYECWHVISGIYIPMFNMYLIMCVSCKYSILFDVSWIKSWMGIILDEFVSVILVFYIHSTSFASEK